ncbi:hypothetical protein FRC01_007222 [Tulasnella sp. 417]|nr:hypothetical protein FRC01_007222 [Tulasnella sp. 417]
MMDNASQRPVRPAMNRGSTAPTPIYQRRQQHSADGDDPAMRLAGLSRIDESGSRTPPGAPTTDTVRRTLGASEVTATTSSRPMLSPALVPSSSSAATTTTTTSTTTTSATTTNTSSLSAAPPQGLFTPPQTPSSSTTSFPRLPSGMTSPRIIDSERSAAIAPPTYFPMASYQPPLPQEPPQQAEPVPSPSPSSATWTPMAPSVSAASSSSITPSQLRRQSPQAEIKMEIETSPSSHTLLAPLGSKFTSDAITIAAKKNNVLQIMADRWDQEKDYRDADMSRITAAFTDGLLRVTVRRRTPPEVAACGRGPYRIVAGYS